MITLQDQLKEAQRELALRTRVYPGFVQCGKLTQGQAYYHLAAMQAIVGTLRVIAGAQAQLPLFPVSGTPVPERGAGAALSAQPHACVSVSDCFVGPRAAAAD